MTKAVGEIGWVKIIVQPAQGAWDESNKVKGYVTKKSAEKKETAGGIDTSDLPF